MKNKKILISATLVLLVTIAAVVGALTSTASPDLNVTLPVTAGGSLDISNVTFSLATADMPSETSMMTYKIETPSVTASNVEEIGSKLGFTGSAGYIDDNSKLSMIQEGKSQVEQLSVWINSGALEYILLQPDLLFPSSAPNLPSYDEAKSIAIEFLESNGLLPSDINADEATVETGGTYGTEKEYTGETDGASETENSNIGKVMEHGNEAVAGTDGAYQTEDSATGEIIEEYVTHLLVRFPRSVNDVEIAGPGAQVEVRVGDGGVIAQALRFYQQITPYKEINVKSPTEAYTDLTIGKGSCDAPFDCKSIVVKEVSLVYWMEPVDSDQEYLVPIYVFEGDCLNGSGEYLSPFTGYCQATQ